jgi:hypothetical protein
VRAQWHQPFSDECGGHVTADFLDLMGLPPVGFEMFHSTHSKRKGTRFVVVTERGLIPDMERVKISIKLTACR